jgi:hypothetical protein
MDRWLGCDGFGGNAPVNATFLDLPKTRIVNDDDAIARRPQRFLVEASAGRTHSDERQVRPD